MQGAPPAFGDSTLDSIRGRGRDYLGYLIWVLAILGLLWTINALISLGERLIGMARGLRAALGFSAPAIGPDWWVLGTVAIIGIAGILILLWAYSAYHSAINCRLASTWGPALPAHTKLAGRTLVASTGTVQAKSAYLSALANSPGWNRADLAARSRPM